MNAQLIGRFAIEAKLGAGGMGVVYLARDPELDRRVAVKLVAPHARDDARRLLREAQAMAQLAHPNVVAIYDVGLHDEQLFLAMEFVEGRTLRDWLAAGKRSWREVVGAFVQAGRGLEAAHGVGLVHRDFKPENVLVGRDGRVRVTDFGLARPEGESEMVSLGTESPALGVTTTGTVCGTPAYMAPEQYQGEAVDARGDQFSFCASLYEALYGQLPFGGDRGGQLAGRVQDPPPGARVPPWLRRVVLRGLAQRPDERWPSMADLLAALGRDPAVRRRRLAIAGAALLALGGAAALARRDGPCENLDQPALAMWNPARKVALQNTFLSIARPFAADAWAATEHGLDAYLRGWTQARTEVCRATRVRGEQSEAVLDRRMQCLDQRLREASALVDLWGRVDAEVVARAPQAVAQLSGVTSCSGADVAGAPAPDGPAARARVEELRGRIAEARALHDAGRYQEGRDALLAVAAEAGTLGYRPLVAEASYELGVAWDALGDGKSSEAAFNDAVWAAEASHQDELAAHGWLLLINVIGGREGRDGEAKKLIPRATAAMERVGRDDHLRLAYLAMARGNVVMRAGRYAEALAAFDEALELAARIDGEDSPEAAAMLGESGVALEHLGRYPEAEARYRRQYELTERRLGAHHPDVAEALENLGVAASRRAAYDEARDDFQRALAISRAAQGEGHFRSIEALSEIGATYLEEGRWQPALPWLREAYDKGVRFLGEAHPSVARYAGNLAVALGHLGSVDEALALQRRALALEQAVRPDHPHTGDTLANIGALQHRKGDDAAALASFDQAVAVLERALGRDHPQLALPLVNREVSLRALRRWAEALADAERALAIDEKALGADHPKLVEPLIGAADALLGLGRPAAAVPLLERCLRIMDADGGNEIDDYAEPRFLLARALWLSGGDRRRARDLVAQAREGYVKVDDVAGLRAVDRWRSRAR